MARDLNVFNVGLDSIMPALLAQLQEETVYFEGVTVQTASIGHNSGVAAVSGCANGDTVWGGGAQENCEATIDGKTKAYRAWLLCSIPRAEFMTISGEFRDRYDDLYEKTLEWTIEDRDRRVDWEAEARMIDIKRQEEERAWNREDEIVTRDHTITLDKDRHPLPGRRFSVVGSQ